MTSSLPIDRRRAVAAKDKRRRARKDDIPRCESVESIPFDASNLEPANVSPYDGISDSEDTPVKQNNSSFNSNMSEASGSQLSTPRSHSASQRTARCASPTDQNVLQRVNETYKEKNNEGKQNSRGQPSPADRAQDIPSCPQMDHMNEVKPIALNQRQGSSADFAKTIDTATKILSQAFSMVYEFSRHSMRYPTPAAIMVFLAFVYLAAIYLELSIASAIDFIVNLCWPLTHIALRFVEHVLKTVGRWIAQTDDLSHAVYCDLAQVWCHRFEMMCDSQCSFTNLVMERMRA